MGVTLDSATETDKVFSKHGFNVIVDESILRTITGIRIQLLPNQWIGEELRVTAV